MNRLSHVPTIGPTRDQLGLFYADTSAESELNQNLWARYLNKRVTET